MKKKVLSGLICVVTWAAIAGCGTSAKEEKAETDSGEFVVDTDSNMGG